MGLTWQSNWQCTETLASSLGGNMSWKRWSHRPHICPGPNFLTVPFKSKSVSLLEHLLCVRCLPIRWGGLAAPTHALVWRLEKARRWFQSKESPVTASEEAQGSRRALQQALCYPMKNTLGFSQQVCEPWFQPPKARGGEVWQSHTSLRKGVMWAEWKCQNLVYEAQEWIPFWRGREGQGNSVEAFATQRLSMGTHAYEIGNEYSWDRSP